MRYNDRKGEYSGDYVTTEVLDEMEQILEGNTPWKCDYYHTTRSAALPSIGKKKAIVSARTLEEEGTRPITGEYCEKTDRKGKPTTIGGKGLLSVYVSRSSEIFGYSFISWFDQYGVGFGINRERLARYYEDNDMKLIEHESYGGDGIPLGEIVPLDCVDIIYCNFVDKTKVEEWIEQSNLHCRVVSAEASQLLNSNRSGNGVEAKKKWVREIKSREKVLLE